MKSWIEVSAERLAENYRATLKVVAKEAARPARTAAAAPGVLAVIKANAYGHGAAICAPVLARSGAEWLGVTDTAEGAAVRAALAGAGITQALQPRILVMCGQLAEDAAAIVEHQLTPVAWDRDQLAVLAAASRSGPVGFHLEVDSGMSRQGVAVRELPELLAWIAREPKLRLNGVMTHFASAEVAGSEQTAWQRGQFEEALAAVAAAGLRPEWVHAGNTSAVDNGADGVAGCSTIAWLAGVAERLGARAMVREGLGLYGYCLPLEGLVAADGDAARLRGRVRPVMTWKTRVIGLSEVEAGARIGYSGTFVAERSMRLALLPVGYADGLRRELSGTNTKPGGWVMFGGRRAPIIGRVSMNLTTVDVTGIDGIAVGDEVVLLGEGSTAEDHAALAGTIAYEILCGMRAEAVLV